MQQDYNVLANEIKVLKKLQSLIAKTKDKKRGKYILDIIEYGMIILKNDGSDKNSETIVGFMIVPKYKQNLQEFLDQ